MKHLVLSTIAILLAGCATGPLFKELEAAPSDQVQLYIYRPWALYAGTVHEVHIDGQKNYLRLPNGGWQRVLLSPGRHSLGVIDTFGVMHCGGISDLTLKAGETVYLAEMNKSQYVAISNQIAHGCIIVSKSADEAKNDLSGLRNAN